MSAPSPSFGISTYSGAVQIYQNAAPYLAREKPKKLPTSVRTAAPQNSSVRKSLGKHFIGKILLALGELMMTQPLSLKKFTIQSRDRKSVV